MAAPRAALTKDIQKVCDLTETDTVQKEDEAKAEHIVDLEQDIEKYTKRGNTVIVKDLKEKLAAAKKDTTSKVMNQAVKCLVGDRQRAQNEREQRLRPMEEQPTKIKESKESLDERCQISLGKLQERSDNEVIAINKTCTTQHKEKKEEIEKL